MSDSTPRFELPFIQPGQAQKELFHNEASVRLDAPLHAAVEGAPLAQVPAEPQQGQCWIVAAGAGGAWSGKDQQLAAWTSGGWRFVLPRPGMRLWSKAAGYWVHWTGSAWTSCPSPALTAARQQAILSPSGGTTIDVEARVALGQIIATLMSHGLTG